MTPIHAGGNRALCRLKSGEYVCVDTNSMDSIDYLIGFDMEADVMPVFQQFLTPSSVVLDIGANVGLYTVTTGTVIREHGQLYAFEGNPHTFDLLQRSVYASRLADTPRITLVNALVSDRQGRGTLHYEPDRLVGATMRDVSQHGGRWVPVEADMITIDGFLPATLKVDLVKIDVEGYEPFVLKGMEKTIANSPNIRIIIEFFPSMVEPAFGAGRFMSYIRDLGFGICEILPGGRLALVDLARGIPGAAYLLLTRTPQQDVERDYFSLPMTGFSFPKGFGAENGIFVYDAGQRPVLTSNVLLHGPYISLKPGRYAFWFLGTLDGELGVRFTAQFGKATFKKEIRHSFDEPSIIDLSELAEHFEIVLDRTDSLKSIRLSEVRVVVL